jgi:hypothetical protein
MGRKIDFPEFFRDGTGIHTFNRQGTVYLTSKYIFDLLMTTCDSRVLRSYISERSNAFHANIDVNDNKQLFWL